MMKIRIGKAEDNDFVINDQQVSRYHAVLTDDNGVMYLEDLGSTNGTFVNDCQIAKMRVAAGDKVVFGLNYTLSIRDVLRGDNDYSEEFALLKNVYDDYVKEKVRIQSSNQFKTRLFQSMPFALIGVVGVAFSLIGRTGHSWIFVASLILTVCAPTIGIYFGARQAAKIPAQLQQLANKFKIDYVCPKCGTYLGEIPWESLRNKRQCPMMSCKAKWVRT